MGSVSSQYTAKARREWELPLLIGIVVLALGLRITVAVVTRSWVFSGESNYWRFGYEMGQIAASLAMGNGFSWPEWSLYPQGEPTAWMAPVYPLIMAAAFKVFGLFSQQAAVALVLFLTAASVLTCVFLYFLGKRLYNPQVGLLAALLLAIYPPAIHFAVRNLWDTSLFICCLLLVILLFLRLANRPRVKEGVWLGILMGFTALVNPIIVIAYPFALIWLYLNAEDSRPIIIRTIAAMLIVSCMVISPWLVRNYVVFGQFTFIKSNFGNELYLGNNEYSTGGFEDAITSRINMSKVFSEAELALLKQSNEVTQNKILFRQAIAFIVEHPLRFAQQTVVRFIRYWIYTEPMKGWQEKLALLAYLIVLSLAAASLLLSSEKEKNLQLVLVFLLSLPLPYYFTIVRVSRYRLPIEPILMLFAAYTVYWIACRWGNVFVLLPQMLGAKKAA